MKLYTFVYVVRTNDLDIVNILSKFFSTRVKITILGGGLANVSLTRESIDPYTDQKKIENLLEGIGLDITLKGIQHKGQTISIN
jgi:hypothetical protein